MVLVFIPFVMFSPSLQLHFLDNEVRSVIHAAELSDVSEYAGKPDRVFFSMTLRGPCTRSNSAPQG